MKNSQKAIVGVGVAVLIGLFAYKKYSSSGKIADGSPKIDTSGATGIDFARKAISLNFLDEPKTLDAQKASD